MDILDNSINRRAMEGELPGITLYPAIAMEKAEVDYKELGAEGMSVLEDNSTSLHYLFSVLIKKAKEINLLRRPELYNSEINCLINTGCDINALTEKTYEDASKTKAFVTLLDEMLWIGASDYQMQSNVSKDNNSMMYTWILMLITVQEKELHYNKTIKETVLSSADKILDIIVGNWGIEESDYFVSLTTEEENELNSLYERRENIKATIKKETEEGFGIAEITNEEWINAIDYINDLSSKESDVIKCINSTLTARDKLLRINEYNSILNGIDRGHYFLKNKEIQLLDIYDSIIDRLNKAPMQCRLKTMNGNSFRASQMIFALGLNPRTYNYLFISYHQFRMSPNKDNAKKFMTLAVDCIRKNLMAPENKCISINDIISEFYTIIFNFIKTNQSSIDQLSFDKIQKDGVTLDSAFIGLSSAELLQRDIIKDVAFNSQDLEIQQKVDSILADSNEPLDINKVKAQAQMADEANSLYEEIALARQIIVSLNIIYLFCDTLRIILTSNNHLHLKVDVDKVKQYRNDLRDLDQKLVFKVYSNLNDNELGMLEYREEAGIDSKSLTEQETQAETCRNETFSIVLKDTISELIEGLEEKDVDQIMEIKAHIKDELLRFPGCDQKGQYADWLDSISKRLSNVLIDNCKSNENTYLQIKQKIFDNLGKDCNRLPSSTLDSLTTAEMLYGEYALKEYAEAGFDYSCISALYYQAFEDAYNDLIWHGYAEMLNSMTVNNQKYTSILESCRKNGIKIQEARGYLDPDPGTRGFYITYKNKKNPETKVNERCMYKSFAIMMENVSPNAKVQRFCDYFAQVVGFDSTDIMLNDNAFMQSCFEFTRLVNASTDNRNNASHGGSYIDMDQCTIDRITVLHNLEQIRVNSIGLIQKMLFLLYSHRM